MNGGRINGEHGPGDSSLASDINRALGGPADIDLLEEICKLHAELKPETSGQVASYIPALTEVDPDQFAISVVTVDGETFSVGHNAERFTLQSIVAPFLYGAVLDRHGRAEVLEHVGVEPSGNPFHEIVLARRGNRPMNPMINGGVLAITGLIPGNEPSVRLRNMLECIEPYIGSRPEMDIRAYVSEKNTADRNRSIAYLMRNFGRIHGEVEPLLDLYIQACSVRVNADELALMAATLANTGINPKTGARAIEHQSLRDVLTVMFTCGLYEASGSWVYRVGVPAKSGVAGGLMAVVPGVMGIGVFSPRVDSAGNSVRGMKACDQLIGRLGLHVFGGRGGDAVIDAPIADPTQSTLDTDRDWVHENVDPTGQPSGQPTGHTPGGDAGEHEGNGVGMTPGDD